ncbi:TonB-dependent receptor [Sphingobacterium sp. UBA6320]|uniref:TonB-dependent receptor n=1 Tax=Sphingobacterium sp. UBA6320 TaxID=1947510 RepID=UPI0025F57359|nr:TonB-dependent receptor [Sphingobacterium sp. UBA6320]
MLKLKIIWLNLFLIISLTSYAQQKGELKGKVSTNSNEPIEGATITLIGTSQVTQADKNGLFSIKNLAFGNHTIRISAVGHQAKDKAFHMSQLTTELSTIHLTTQHTTMDEVEIVARSEAQEVQQQPFNVTAIDAKKLYNTTMDIGQALNRVSGVRLRESGGVGSNMSFSLNGFSGNQIKLFLDGIPMDNFGSSFQLNNIPINFAERVEVYRGVVPVWLGGDALGGAVNIVTKNQPGKYIDASYSFGSFNTHKSSVNTGYVADNGFTMTLSAFQNYSDNNYWVNVRSYNFDTEKYFPAERRKRFHDTYRNETLIYNIGVSNKKYADQLLFGITLGQNKKEIQTGNTMEDVYGGRESLGNIVQPTWKYIKKNLWTKGLDVTLNARYNFGQERSLDTVPRKFTWTGESRPKNPDQPNAPGGENELTDYRYKNNNGNLTANISYAINDQHSIMINHLLTTFDRKGKDHYYPDLEINKLPRKTTKNITGIGFRTAIHDRWDANLFVKNYNQQGKYFTEVSNQVYENLETTTNKIGYGLATSYFVNKDIQLKASYEKAYRLPDNTELFGDALDISANPTLRPESSDNINFGLSYALKWKESNQLIIDANYIYRNATDFIRQSIGPLTSSGKREIKSANLRSVQNNSIDINLKYYYKNHVSIGGNMTYQNLINTTQFEDGQTVESNIYKDRLPNMPYLYGNADVAYYVHHVGKQNNTLTIGYNLQYIHEFFLTWPSLGTPSQRYKIPEQLSHDINIIYSLASGKYNIALECNNLTDATRYDNFEMQKPSRSFNIKFRYFIRTK